MIVIRIKFRQFKTNPDKKRTYGSLLILKTLVYKEKKYRFNKRIKKRNVECALCNVHAFFSIRY